MTYPAYGSADWPRNGAQHNTAHDPNQAPYRGGWGFDGPVNPGPAGYSADETQTNLGAPMPPQRPSKKRNRGLLIIGLVVAVILGGCGLISFLALGTEAPQHPVAPLLQPTTTKPAPTYSTDPAPATEEAEEKPQTFEAGTYEVGKVSDPEDGTIKPGTFILITPDHCYWERVSNFEGDFDSIISNGNLTATGSKPAQGRITIKRSDKGLTLSGECILGQKGGLK